MDATHVALFGSIATNGVQFALPALNSFLQRNKSRIEAESTNVETMARVNSALQGEVDRLNKRLERQEWEAEQWKEIAVSSSRLITTATEVAAKKSPERPQDV